MIRASYVSLLLLLTLILDSSAQTPKSGLSPRADSLEILFLDGEQPTRLEFRVEIDGKSVPAVWDDRFAQLYAYLDRDSNGVLDANEARRLPSAFALRQLLWGQVSPFSGVAHKFVAIDLNGDNKILPDELADFYRRAGLGGVLVGVGKAPATDSLTESLIKHLDCNKDGVITEEEWKVAADSLKTLDANDDELVGPGELVEGLTYPGAIGSILVTAPTPETKSDAITDALPFLVLPLRTADRHWELVAQLRREQASRTLLRKEWFLAARKSPPTAIWGVRFGEKLVGGQLEFAEGQVPPSARLVYSSGALQFELRADEGKLADPVAIARNRYRAQFAEADTDGNDSLDATELDAPKAAIFQSLARVADRNSDGALSHVEFIAWLDLQGQLAKSHVLLTVIDHGNGLYELLDTDHDGSLSVRELRSAWNRLKAAGCVTEGRFDREKLPRQLLAAISRGHPKSSPGKAVRAGPPWFVAMDRNGDGDVSLREFAGPTALFRQFDTDGDGLLSAEESAKMKSTK